MSKFEVKLFWGTVHHISDENNNYLHSDGSVYSVTEYFPTREQAQAVLDKFRPAPPPHVWVHGDVFKSKGELFICFQYTTGESLRIFDLDGPIFNSVWERCLDEYFSVATFLFNIKDKL